MNKLGNSNAERTSYCFYFVCACVSVCAKTKKTIDKKVMQMVIGEPQKSLASGTFDLDLLGAILLSFFLVGKYCL